MSGVPEGDSPAPTGLRGVLRSWLQSRFSETGRLPQVPASEAAGPNLRTCRSIRVLVADDNPVNLMLMSALMEPKGFLPVLAADGAEAVALACQLHFDLILMDLQMPILDGMGALSAIRRFEAGGSRPAVPVIAYSSSSPGAGVLAAHGFNGTLSKPCGDQELENCLVQWCPTYRPAFDGRGVQYDSRSWLAPSRNSGSSGASPG